MGKRENSVILREPRELANTARGEVEVNQPEATPLGQKRMRVLSTDHYILRFLILCINFDPVFPNKFRSVQKD